MERTLSQNEAKVVLSLEWRGQRTVTLAELRTELAASEGYARYVAHRLVKKGWLERLRPGLFQLVPADRGREGVGDTHPLTVGAILVEPYFFSYGTACTIHGLTEQVFAEVYVACTTLRKPEMIRGNRYVFVRVREARFFGYEKTTVLGEPVQMATRERALLDAIDRPRYAGGIGEVSRIVGRAGPDLAWERLLEFAGRWGESAIVQRLGYFLDLHDVESPREVRKALLKLVRPTSKVHLGPRRRWGTTGTLARPWNVIINVPEAVLAEQRERRRRVRFRTESGKG